MGRCLCFRGYSTLKLNNERLENMTDVRQHEKLSEFQLESSVQFAGGRGCQFNLPPTVSESPPLVTKNFGLGGRLGCNIP